MFGWRGLNHLSSCLTGNLRCALVYKKPRSLRREVGNGYELHEGEPIGIRKAALQCP